MTAQPLVTTPTTSTRSWRNVSVRTRTVVLAVALLVLLTGVSQLVLPMLATWRLRNSLERHALDVHVSVSAFPAVKLLLHKADRVEVRIGRLLATGSDGSLTSLLERIGHAQRLDAVVGSMTADGLRLTAVSLHKRGNHLAVRASVTRDAITSALPSWLHLSKPTTDRSSLLFTLMTRVLGKSIVVPARVQVSGGKLEIGPALPELAFVRISVFADPEVRLDSLTMSTVGGTYIFDARGEYT